MNCIATVKLKAVIRPEDGTVDILSLELCALRGNARNIVTPQKLIGA